MYIESIAPEKLARILQRDNAGRGSDGSGIHVRIINSAATKSNVHFARERYVVTWSTKFV